MTKGLIARLAGVVTVELATLAGLRKKYADWKWRAERTGYGLGWFYVGSKDGRTVDVRAYSVLSGYSDDDYRTEWRVEEDGKPSTALLLWCP